MTDGTRTHVDKLHKLAPKPLGHRHHVVLLTFNGAKVKQEGIDAKSLQFLQAVRIEENIDD